MSIKKLTAQMSALEQQRQKVLLSFMLNKPLIKGSITQTKGRCGKPNCECAQKPSHPITLLMTTANGKKRSQLIRKDDVDRIKKLWQVYKNLVSLLRTLKEIHQKEINLLRLIILKRSVEY
jgi:hypothetical protein